MRIKQKIKSITLFNITKFSEILDVPLPYCVKLRRSTINSHLLICRQLFQIIIYIIICLTWADWAIVNFADHLGIGLNHFQRYHVAKLTQLLLHGDTVEDESYRH